MDKTDKFFLIFRHYPMISDDIYKSLLLWLLHKFSGAFRIILQYISVCRDNHNYPDGTFFRIDHIAKNSYAIIQTCATFVSPTISITNISFGDFILQILDTISYNDPKKSYLNLGVIPFPERNVINSHQIPINYIPPKSDFEIQGNIHDLYDTIIAFCDIALSSMIEISILNLTVIYSESSGFFEIIFFAEGHNNFDWSRAGNLFELKLELLYPRALTILRKCGGEIFFISPCDITLRIPVVFKS